MKLKKHNLLGLSFQRAVVALIAAAAMPAHAATVNLNAVADTFINSRFPGNNAGGMTFFDVGSDSTIGMRRGLLKFDLSSIPAGSIVSAVTLRAQVVKQPPAATPCTIDLHRLNAAWNEGANATANNGGTALTGESSWTARILGTADWTAGGGLSDAVEDASASADAVSPGSTMSWSGAGLVADVQAWRDTPAQNFGWLMVAQQEATGSSVRELGARENGTPPTLEVQYLPPNAPPTVAITNPAAGNLNAASSFLIQAAAADSDGSVTQVQFFDASVSLGIDTTPPFSINATLFAGTHNLIALATDNVGGVTASAVVTVTVVTTPIADPIVPRIAKGDITVELKPIADGMVSPLGMAAPDDGSGRMFVYDQVGIIWVVTAAGRLPTPLLDLRTRLANISGAYDERGLLGLAVHTNFAQNPFIYTYTSEFTSGPADFATVLTAGTTNNHQSVIAEWRLNPSTTNQVDAATRREVLRIDEPQSNHNGGTMRFGPDGLLYVSLGDGGQADDQGNGHSPGGNGQDTTNILGTVIRIDVDARTSANGKYGVPASNPFVGVPGVDEIYAYGLRNPFSFSFDRGTGLLYLGDVGQNKVEEVDIIYKGSNYGWNLKEGSFYFDPNGAGAGYVTTFPVRPVPPDLVDPIAEYDHDDGTAVIGGYVYRGSQVPSLSGRYVFGDWGIFGAPSGRLYYLDNANTVKELRIGLTDRPLGQYLKGFGEDSAGELYVFTSKGQGPQGNGGVMYKIVPPPTAPVSISNIRVTNDTFCTLLAGGVGPILQQRKTVITEPVWANELFTTGGNTNVPVRGGAGFFRASDTALQRTVPFTAWVSPLNEHPATASTAEGFGIFGLEGNSLTFTITYRGLTGPATGAHFHGPAPAASNAPVLIDLKAYHNGAYAQTGSFSGTIVLSPLEKTRLMAGQLYFNIHTVANGGGEMRGQLAPVTMNASLLGANESPVVNTPATALGSFTLVGTQLSFAITYRGLTGPATAAHIHGPADIGQSASPIIDFSPFVGGVYGSNGVVKGVVGLTPAQLEAVIDGRTYVNFHTVANGNGEIRGQILPQSTAVPLTAWISGLNERNTPLTNSASGLGILSLEGDTLAFNFHYSGLSGPPIGAHIHGASATTASTGIQVDLAPYHNGPYTNTSGSFSGSVLLTPAQRTMVLNGQTYFNIHTADKTGGEARGNISSVLMSAYANGTAERPTPLSVSAAALGMFTLIHTQLSINVVYSGLSTPATGAHIHAPANSSATAGVVINFAPFVPGYGSFGGIYGIANVVHTNVNHLIDGLGYMNLHTTTNSGGEIRGQVGR